MKKFYAQLSDKSTMHVPADRMVIDDNMVYVYNGDQLVALADVGMILYAHFSIVSQERKEGCNSEL